LKDYEVKFSVDFSKFYQPYASSLSLDKFDECAVIDSELPVVDSVFLLENLLKTFYFKFP